MAALPILQLGDPILRQPARRISREELASVSMQTFIDDLIATMDAANGAGIAAPQVGHSVAIAVVHVQDNPRYPYKPNVPLTVFVNPTLTLLTDDVEMLYEGCLSVPNLRGMVPRHMHVRVDAWDRQGAPIVIEARGLTAGTYQHEFDHLEGLLFVDRVSDPSTFSTWDNFDRFHKATFVERAISINQRYK